MTSEIAHPEVADHRRTSEIFVRVYELPPAERPQAITEACGEDSRLRRSVELLLALHDRRECAVDRPPIAPAELADLSRGAHDADQSAAALLGRRIGQFTLTRLLTSGGMGLVFEAQQENPARVVAIKIMRQGLATHGALARFDLESQTLARLQHPGIAQVYEAGTFEHGGAALPYFAMELVRGARSITDFATQRELNLPQRLVLFEKVCHAVHHGHQHGVIHRDLKPANILVGDDGEPRIIDFGIARTIGDEEPDGFAIPTIPGQVIGTPQYMSPEQCTGDSRAIDTRSDVYSLGAVLYELACGRTPLDLQHTPLPEAVRRVRDEDPPPLGAVDRSLRGDLETIAAMAMAKEPARRYQSAESLGHDVRRFLERRPVMARRPSASYVLSRFVRRNRAASIVACALGLAMMIAAAAAIALAIEARQQRDAAVNEQKRTQRALNQAKSVAEVVKRAFNGTSMGQKTITITDLVAEVERALESQVFDDADAEAMLRVYLANAYLTMLRVDDASAQAERAVALRRELAQEGSLDLVDALRTLSSVRYTQLRNDEGESLLREAVHMRRRLLGPEHLSTVPDHSLLAALVVFLPDEPESRGVMHEAADAAHDASQPSEPSATQPNAIALHEDFDAAQLDPAWMVMTEDLVSWKHTLAESRLTCTAIEPREFTSDRPKPALVILARPIDALQDFRLDASLGWDNCGTTWAIQCLEIVVFGVGGNEVCRVAYADHWNDAEGERMAIIHRGQQGAVVKRSGVSSLPAAGQADVMLQRTGATISVLWNGRLLARGFDDEPIGEVQIWMHRLPYVLRGRRASFGELWIDRVHVSGTAAISGP